MRRLGCRRVIHDCRPDEMVSLEGDGSKDQLKSESMGVLLAKGVPRLPWCDDRDSQEQVNGECQNGLLVLI